MEFAENRLIYEGGQKGRCAARSMKGDRDPPASAGPGTNPSVLYTEQGSHQT